MAILDSRQYLARQGIPLRGHGSDEDSNFLQLLMMKPKKFRELKAWLEKKQGKFVTHDVQNEILPIMSNSVLGNMLKKIEAIFTQLCLMNIPTAPTTNNLPFSYADWRP